MAHILEFGDDELRLMLQALADAIAYRDARSHVVQSAVRRRARRGGIGSAGERDAGDEHRRLVSDYQRIAQRLRSGGR